MKVDPKIPGDNPGKGNKGGRYKQLVFDAATGQSKLVDMTEEEIQAIDNVEVPEAPETQSVDELIAEIDNAMTLAELRQVLVKIVAPEIAKERKMR